MKRYEVRIERSAKTGILVHLRDRKAGLRVSCAPKFGFLWHRFEVTPPGKKDPVELFHRAKFPPTDMDDGMCPILFPLVGRLRRGNREGIYRRSGRDVRMPIHGFAKDLPWSLVEAESSSTEAYVTAQLTDSAKTRKMYDWPFELVVTYCVADGAVHVITAIDSDGPWTLGFHPYLRLPLSDRKDARDRCLVRVPVASTWDEKHLVPTGVIRPIAKNFPLAKGVRISNVDCDQIFTDVTARSDGTYAMEYYDPAARAGVAIEPSAKVFSEVVIYCRKGEPYVCIEPWTAPPNALNTGWGLTSAGTAVRSTITFRPIFQPPRG
ncbi:MAG: hypothetical protein V2A58_07740 [Planctomycetota bacterium]